MFFCLYILFGFSFFPIPINHNQPLYKKSILLPSIRGGESSPKGCAGEGLSYSAFTFPAGFSLAAL